MRMLIKGWYGAGNVGDDALAWSLVRAVSLLTSGIRPAVLTTKRLELPDPTVEQWRYALNRGYGIKICELAWSLLRAQVLAIGGGDALVEGNGSDCLRGLEHTLWLSRTARAIGKRVAFFGVSVRYRSKLARRLVRKICDLSDVIVVREPESYQLVQDTGTATPTLLMPDLSYMMADQLADSQLSRREVLGIAPLALRGDHSRVRDVLSGVIKDVLAGYPRMSLVLFGFHAYDQGLAIDIVENLQLQECDKYRIRIEQYSSNPVSMLNSIAQCDYMMTVRLHPAIFATMSRRPLLAVEGRPTVRNVLRYVGYPPRSVVPYDTIYDRRVILSMLECMFRSPNEYCAAIEPTSLRSKVLSTMSAALRILESHVEA